MHAKLLNMEADLREAEVQLEIAQRSKRNLQKEMEKLESEVNRSQRQYDGIVRSLSQGGQPLAHTSIQTKRVS